MNDPIDRQAVLHALKDAFGKYEDKVDIEVELITSVLKIPSANLQPACNKLATDCISRQAAIDALNGQISVTGDINAKAVQNYIRMVNQRLHDLPSAQPEKVKCKKCRYVYYDKEFGNYWCNRKPDSFMVEEDGYCKWGK